MRTSAILPAQVYLALGTGCALTAPKSTTQPRPSITPASSPAPSSDELQNFVGRQATVHGNPRLRVRRLLAEAADGHVARATPMPGTTVRDVTLTPEELQQILASVSFDDGARAALLEQNVVPVHVSDLDGTLWMAPIADALVYDTLAASGRLKPVIRQRLSELMRDMGLEPSGLEQADEGVNADVLRVKATFDARKSDYSADELIHWSREVYPLTSWALAGFGTDEVRAMTRQVIADGGLGSLAFAGAKAQIDALRQAGIPTVLFSASNDVLAQEAVNVIFGTSPGIEVIGTHVRVDANDTMTDEVEGGPCFREVKLAKVHRFLRDYVARTWPNKLDTLDLDSLRPLLASGDSPSKTDEQMMDDAVIACAVEPGTVRDVKRALDGAQQRGNVFILDYLMTAGNRAADTFRADDPFAGARGAL